MQVVLGGVNIVSTEKGKDQFIPVLRAFVHEDYRRYNDSYGSLLAISNDVGESWCLMYERQHRFRKKHSSLKDR